MFFQVAVFWRMLTWTFIYRSQPAILRRTWSHAHLFLLQGTSLQFSKSIVLWKENRNLPKASVVHKHQLQFACESFSTEFPQKNCTEAKQGRPWARSLPSLWLKTHFPHLPIYFTTLHLQPGFKRLIIAHLSLASFWHTSWTKCHISLLMTITTAPALSSL